MDAKPLDPQLQQHFDRVDREVVELRRKIDGHEIALAENTRLTRVIDDKLTRQIESTQPVVDALATMQSGIRTIGRIGTFAGNVGRWTFRVTVTAVALWLAGAVFLKTGSVASAMQEFVRIFAGAGHP